MGTEAVDKVTFAERQRDLSRDLLLQIHILNEYRDIYFTNGWNSGGSSPIIDADITEAGIPAADLGSFANLVAQLVNFRDDIAVTKNDWGVVARHIASVESVNVVF